MKERRPKLLITNDDGINAPGIRHLWEALSPFADLTIVAPAQEQSGVGLSMTYRSPLLIHENKNFPGSKAWEVNGTPADCVKMAVKVILASPPDLVVSGINRGCNAGRNVLYSGTVGGAIEGVLQGIPGIAFSCRDFLLMPAFSEACEYIPSIVQHVLEQPLPEGTLLNVNFPYKEGREGIRGIKLARQGKGFWGEAPEQRIHPAGGHAYYWMGVQMLEFPEDAESDINLLDKGYIAAVPIHVSALTDEKHYNKNKELFEASLNSALINR